MNYYDYVTIGVGYVWSTILLVRLGPVWFDSRIFYRCFKQMKVKRPGLFTLRRVVVPGVLSGPLILWMDPYNFLRRGAAPEIWDAAQYLLEMYEPSCVPEGRSNLPTYRPQQ